MKTSCSNRKNRALTLVEMMVVLFSLFLLIALLVPALSAPRIRTAVGCINHLRECGAAFRVWEGDHGDRYPMATVSLCGTNAGLAEAVFQSLSNQLSSTRILVCPADRSRLPASTFRTLSAKSISYFVNMDAAEASPQDILMGDDNLSLHGMRVKSGLLILSNNAPLKWTGDRHRLHGNLLLSDGSVQGAVPTGLGAYLSKGTNAASATNSAWVRLAIP